MRILLVDDENRNADHLRKGLVESGFSVDIVPGGEGGLDLACKAEYDLLVLDGLSGIPLLTELRRSGRQTPVLFLSGQVRAAAAAGATSDSNQRLAFLSGIQ